MMAALAGATSVRGNAGRKPNLLFLIADDHALVRQGFRMILAAQPDIEIVGEASNVNEAEKLINEGDTQLVFLDATTRKMVHAPKDLVEKLKEYFV